MYFRFVLILNIICIKFSPNVKYFFTPFTRPPTHLILGRLYHRQKRNANAYRHFKTYLDLSPESPDKTAIRTLLNTLADSQKASGKGWVVTDPSTGSTLSHHFDFPNKKSDRTFIRSLFCLT